VLSHAAVLTVVMALLASHEAPTGSSRYDGGAKFRSLEGSIRVTGRLVDAETRRPVTRAQIWIHGFNDAFDAQASLEPGPDRNDFELFLPAPDLRLRIADRSDEYALFERLFVAKDGQLDVEIALQPTHWLVLRGRVLWDDHGTLRPVGRGRHPVVGAPIIDVFPDGHLNRDSEGRYEGRVPREELEFSAVSTALRLEPSRLDLRGATEDERELDLIFRAAR
jgi:hypothetical protein